MSFCEIFEFWKRAQRCVLSDRLVGRDALGVVGVVQRQAGEEEAVLLGRVGGHVLVDRGGELAFLERLGEVVALVGGEAFAAGEQRVGEGLQVARLAELEGDGGGAHRVRPAHGQRHAGEGLRDEPGSGRRRRRTLPCRAQPRPRAARLSRRGLPLPPRRTCSRSAARRRRARPGRWPSGDSWRGSFQKKGRFVNDFRLGTPSRPGRPPPGEFYGPGSRFSVNPVTSVVQDLGQEQLGALASAACRRNRPSARPRRSGRGP